MRSLSDIYRGRRILVTGHTGFKGSWLTLWLMSLGAEVAGYSLGLPSKPCNYELLELESRISHFSGDIRDHTLLGEFVDDFRPEIVFHLAAQSLVQCSYEDPLTTFETNVMGMANLLDVIWRRPWIEVAVLITSDKAYRNEEWCWGYREMDALGGKDPYSGSKGCAELVANSYFHSFLQHTSTRMATTRAGNVIGGGDWADNRIVPDCIRAWAERKPVCVRHPHATRPWQHVLEPLSGYLWLGAGLWKKQKGLNGEAFNFGPHSNVDKTVAELLDMMSVHWPGAGWEAPDGLEPAGHEATLLKLSCDKAQARLGWLAVMDFSETVEFTANWYRKMYEGTGSMYDYSISQIEEYCRLARDRGVAWSQ